MARRTLRLLCLAALAGLVVVCVRRRARLGPSSTDTGSRTGTPPAGEAHSTATVAVTSDPPPTQPRWLPAVDGACPPGHAVKVNESSGIFHLPGGRFYQRTNPDRCYATADEAEADGYRRAKA